MRKIILLLLITVPLITRAQTEEATWNYPVHMGTEEWNQLNSFSERLNAFNIPDDILTKMTTENLVKTCLKYPWWILITSRDNNQAGYNYLKSVFNGFRELEKRKDAGKELLKVYEKMIPEKRLELQTLIEKGKYSYQFVFIETLLSQTAILENLTKQDLTHLLDVTTTIFQNKNNPAINYSLLNLSSTGFLLANILEKEQSEKFSKITDEYSNIERFMLGGLTDDKKLLIRIYEAAEEYHKNL